MMLISGAGAIVLTIFAVIVTTMIIFLLIISIRRQERKLREENAVLVDTMLTKSAMRENINTYATKIGSFGSFTLFYISIDEFETLNEILGQEPVNTIVRDIAERLVRMFKGVANIAQFDENSFLIFDKKEYTYDDLQDTADRLLDLVSENSTSLRNQSINVTASIGVAVYPTCGITFKELFSNLELATYIANRQGGNKYIIYYNELKDEESGNLEYFNEVRDAMSKGELTLFYQPIVSVKTYALYGFEALLRWEHPVHGIIPPSKFIPILEQSGDITFLAKWSLEQVIRLQQVLEKIYPKRDIKLTINLSVKQMMEEGMADDFKKIIKKYNADPHRIILEVAQYAMFEKMNAVRVNLLRLRDAGFLISTDGLGLDYSSISQIETKPIDILKLDKGFLEDIEDNQMQERYVQMLAESSERAGRTVICEGVEDYSRLEYVKKNNIEYIQGYYISKPFPGSEVQDYVHEEAWKQRIQKDMENIQTEDTDNEELVETVDGNEVVEDTNIENLDTQNNDESLANEVNNEQNDDANQSNEEVLEDKNDIIDDNLANDNLENEVKIDEDNEKNIDLSEGKNE